MSIDYSKTSFNDVEKERLFKEAQHVRQKYPDRIPILVQSRAKDIKLTKHKYLVPQDLTVGQFMYVIRKRIRIKPEEAIFLFINNIIPPSSSIMSLIYNEHVDPDIGMLVAIITRENTFGKNEF